MTATVTIVGFAKDADQKEASENIAVFEGLNVKFTRSGYKITAPMVKSTTTGVGNVSDATIKDVEFNIIDQGIRFNGKYETNTYEAETAGTMFNEKQSNPPLRTTTNTPKINKALQLPKSRRALFSSPQKNPI